MAVLNPHEFVGKRFGGLVVKYVTRDHIGKEQLLFCRCDCGHTTKARARDLYTGHTVSCGCRKTEVNRSRYRGKIGDKYVKFELLSPEQ